MLHLVTARGISILLLSHLTGGWNSREYLTELIARTETVEDSLLFYLIQSTE
jgi:hypothetical protein